jgi:hypothetical protein
MSSIIDARDRFGRRKDVFTSTDGHLRVQMTSTNRLIVTCSEKTTLEFTDVVCLMTSLQAALEER